VLGANCLDGASLNAAIEGVRTSIGMEIGMATGQDRTPIATPDVAAMIAINAPTGTIAQRPQGMARHPQQHALERQPAQRLLLWHDRLALQPPPDACYGRGFAAGLYPWEAGQHVGYYNRRLPK
jgi:hypothetical protein